jgi:multidrug resistance efflux pump
MLGCLLGLAVSKWVVGTLEHMISVAECKTYAAECERLGRAADISIQRATALISMAQSWETLAEDTARYEAIVQAETIQAEPRDKRIARR